MRRLTQADYVTTRWSGGTTTQIAISPAGADYGARDFLWRVSSATVETEASDFTALPDYHRFIAPLRGEMTLTHNGGESVTLRPYRVHGFSGGAATQSRGRCTDFNLMLRRGAMDGSMEALTLSGQDRELTADSRACEVILYCAEGTCTVSDGAERLELAPGEAVYVRRLTALRLRSGAQKPAAVMVCRMWSL